LGPVPLLCALWMASVGWYCRALLRACMLRLWLSADDLGYHLEVRETVPSKTTICTRRGLGVIGPTYLWSNSPLPQSIYRERARRFQHRNLAPEPVAPSTPTSGGAAVSTPTPPSRDVEPARPKLKALVMDRSGTSREFLNRVRCPMRVRGWRCGWGWGWGWGWE
jgi:hypothetical protein